MLLPFLLLLLTPAAVDAATMSSPVDVAAFANIEDNSSDSSLGGGSPSEDDDRGGGGSDGRDEAPVIVRSDRPPSAGSGGSKKSSGLSTLGSLEDALEFRRGLSNHYIGKSRSFADLTACSEGSAADLAKAENPLNKRRRLQIQTRLACMRRASCGPVLMTKSLPPLRELEGSDPHEEEEEEEEDDGDSNDASSSEDDEIGPARGRNGEARSFRLFEKVDQQ